MGLCVEHQGRFAGNAGRFRRPPATLQFAQRRPALDLVRLENDGHDPADNEQNFGTVKDDLEPKPAYTALKTMTAELSGYRLERRLEGLAESDFVLVFVNEAGARKAAAWTLADPHVVHLTGLQPEVSLEFGPLPRYVFVK